MKFTLSRKVLNETVKIIKWHLILVSCFIFKMFIGVEFAITGGAIIYFTEKIQHFLRITLSHSFN